MTRLVWFVGWVGVAIWSLLCAATYGLFDLVGRLFMRNADAFSADPSTVEGIWRVLSVLHSLSTGSVLVAWAVVSLLILAVPWAIDRMIGPATLAPGSGPRPAPPVGGVIDLAPDQYSVGPARTGGSAWTGAPPRIPPARPLRSRRRPGAWPS